jgi:hypothetical protein
MGTRELAVLVIDMNTNVYTNYTASNSLFAKAIRSLETAVEIYAIFPPAASAGEIFTILVADDTIPQDAGESSGDGGANNTLTDILNDATGGSAVVWNAAIAGDSINYN